MRIEVLGPGRAVDGAGRVLLRDGIPLTLLVFLICADRPIVREHLAELFWPGQPRERALQSLRQTLVRLRVTLGDVGLISVGRSLSIRKGHWSLDLEDFVLLARSNQGSAALRLWRGSFLEEVRPGSGWDLNDWLDSQRSHLAELLAQAVMSEAELLRPSAPDKALDLLRSARIFLPAHPDLLTGHFRLLVETGHQGEAAGLLVECRFQGEEELSEELSEEWAEELARRGGVGVEGHDREPVQGGAEQEVPEIWMEPAPDRGVRPWTRGARGRVKSIAGAMLLAVLLWGAAGFGKGEEKPLSLSLAGSGDSGVLFCVALGPGPNSRHLFEMNLTGAGQARISTLSGCDGVWLPGPGRLLLLERRSAGFAFQLLTPPQTPAQGEWQAREITSTWEWIEPIVGSGGHGVVDGRKVLVSSILEWGTRSIFLLDPLRDEVLRLTDDGGVDSDPIWDPIRRQVIFTSDRGGRSSLWTVGLPEDGHRPTPTPLTESPTWDASPTLAGEWVVFERGADSDSEGNSFTQIWGIHRPTGEVRPLVALDWDVGSPRGTLTREFICWESREFGPLEPEIHVKDLRTGRSWGVSLDQPGPQSDCLWSEKGEHLFYRSLEEDRIPQVVMSDREGRAHVNLSRSRLPSYPVAEFSFGTALD